MDSGTLGANDNNSDLNARERLRWGDNSKVYTRKNFRKKAQLEKAHKESATTSTTATEPTYNAAAAAASTTGGSESTSSSPAKNEFGSKNTTLELSLAETLAAQNANSSEEQPQSRSEGVPSTSDVVRPPEEGTGGQEALPSGGEDPPSFRDHEDQEVPPDVPEAVSYGVREEHARSSGHEALPKMQPTGGQEVLPNGGEEPPRSDGPEAKQEALPCTREDPIVREQSEALPNGGEEEPSTSDVVQQPEEGTGGQGALSSGGEHPPLNSDHEDAEVLPDVPEAVLNGDGEEPAPSSDHEALPEMQPTGGQEELLNGEEEEPPKSHGPEAEQEALPSTREEPPEQVQTEILPNGVEEPSTSDVRPPEDTSGQEALPSGREDPPSNCDQEVLPDVPEAVPNCGREEPAPSSGHEALPEMQPTGGQEEVLLNGGEEELPWSDGPEAEQEALPSTGEALPEREQSEVAVTLPIAEAPDVTDGDKLVNGAASAVLVNGFSKPVITRVEDRVRINITGLRSKDEMEKLKRKLESQLDQVRILVEKVKAKEHQLTAYITSNVNSNSIYVSGSVGNFGGYNQPQLVRANSEVGTLGHQYSRPQLLRVNSEAGSVGYQETRPFRDLSVSVVENNHWAGEFVEKEKRTPKANQYYRNSEFLLGKDRLPPESNKKLKLSAKKHGGNSEYGYGFGFDKNRDKLFRSCSNLLQRLMKHKHGWVFNEPVDAKKLNIPDYHIIIKHPMDFGTIKTRLAQNWYKSAREFAEDVRLVFHNAMTYNPKGQDVHTMAEELSNIFEERWIAIEKEHFPYQMYYDAGLPIPTPRKAPPPPPAFAPAPAPAPILAPFSIPPAPPMRTLGRSESMTMPVDSRLKPSYSNLPHGGRTPVPKKPKAKDPNKRDMTYEEKQKLSTNLQSLPSEKLDAIVQIIKKRNSTVNQHDDEIEVDIDSVDAETLWELDRFVTNYKKSLSKNKRKVELALQRRAEAALAVPTANPTPLVVEQQKESRTGEKNSPVVEVGKKGDNASGSSSSSSSSSDSGSSSSDSDSDSSSAYGSDAGHSPKT